MGAQLAQSVEMDLAFPSEGDSVEAEAFPIIVVVGNSSVGHGADQDDIDPEAVDYLVEIFRLDAGELVNWTSLIGNEVGESVNQDASSYPGVRHSVSKPKRPRRTRKKSILGRDP